MNYVRYQCISEQGEESIVKTLVEAKAFVAQHGGSYKRILQKSETYSQSYVRRNARWKQ